MGSSPKGLAARLNRDGFVSKKGQYIQVLYPPNRQNRAIGWGNHSEGFTWPSLESANWRSYFWPSSGSYKVIGSNCENSCSSTRSKLTAAIICLGIGFDHDRPHQCTAGAQWIAGVVSVRIALNTGSAAHYSAQRLASGPEAAANRFRIERSETRTFS